MKLVIRINTAAVWAVAGMAWAGWLYEPAKWPLWTVVSVAMGVNAGVLYWQEDRI